MGIVSNTIEIGAVQKDGLLSIVERYQRDDGSEVLMCSFVDPKADLNALAASRIATIQNQDAAKAEAKAKRPPQAILDAITKARDAYFEGDVAKVKAALSDATTASSAVVEVQPKGEVIE